MKCLTGSLLRDISPPLQGNSAPQKPGLLERHSDFPYFTLPLSFPALRFKAI